MWLFGARELDRAGRCENNVLASPLPMTRSGSRIPRRKGSQPSRRERQPAVLPKFSKKMHEIEKILDRRFPTDEYKIVQTDLILAVQV